MISPRVRIAGCLLLTLGCGSPELKLVPVAGKVTVRDQPMPCGAVVFAPDVGNASGASAQASIGTDGAYALTTNGKPGAPVGKYRVVVYLESPGGPPPPRGFSIPAKYTNAATTDLTVEVTEAAAPGSYDLKLSR